MKVAPLVGAWIEISIERHSTTRLASLPLWERGLKSCTINASCLAKLVAPLVGAWIEIDTLHRVSRSVRSLPLWERGLK